MSTHYVPVPMGGCDGVMVNIRARDYQCMSQEDYNHYIDERYNQPRGPAGIILLCVLLFSICGFLISIIRKNS